VPARIVAGKPGSRSGIFGSIVAPQPEARPSFRNRRGIETAISAWRSKKDWLFSRLEDDKINHDNSLTGRLLPL
jgi:hypothetical protein